MFYHKVKLLVLIFLSSIAPKVIHKKFCPDKFLLPVEFLSILATNFRSKSSFFLISIEVLLIFSPCKRRRLVFELSFADIDYTVLRKIILKYTCDLFLCFLVTGLDYRIHFYPSHLDFAELIAANFAYQ